MSAGLKTWWLVYNSYNDESPKVRHSSCEEAMLAAEKIALKQGKEVHVLQCTWTCFLPAKPEVTWRNRE
jgi:hypothetical protein